MFAQNDYSTNSGCNWTDASTWTNGVPSTSNVMDTIFIEPGDVVTLDDHVDISTNAAMVIVINGALDFSTGKKLYLPASSVVNVEIGGSIL